MTYDEIVYLLDKYKVRQKGEYWTSDMKLKDQQKRRMDEYLAICDNISDRLYLVGCQKDEAKNIIKTVSLNELHRTANVYTIITAVCVYVKKIYSRNNSLNWKRYKVCKEYELTDQILITVLCNLLKFYRENKYLI